MAVKQKAQGRVSAFADKLCAMFPKKQFYSVGNEKTGTISIMLAGTMSKNRKFLRKVVDKFTITQYTVKEERAYTKDFALSDSFVSLDFKL